MSSIILQAIKNYRKNLHNVGSLNNWGKTVLNQGAVATADMDNYTLATLGFDAKGERTATPLADSTAKGVLVASVEDYMKEYETIRSFFNEKGERVRVVYLESGRRFECSNVSFENEDLSTHPLKNGQLVHYDAATSKFVISNETVSGGTGYAAAANKFILVDKDCVSIDGADIYRFEVQ